MSKEHAKLAEAATVATATKEKPHTDRPTADRLPLWKVLLHDDDVNVIEDVIKAIQAICRVNHLVALRRTLEAHKSGVALLLVTHLEHAEFVRDRFESKLMTVSIEPER